MRRISLLPSGHRDSFARDNLPPPELWPELDLSGLPALGAYPRRLNCAAALLDAQIAAGRGDKPLLFFGDEELTYARVHNAANRIAGVLTRGMGVVPGNRVLLRAGNTPMMVSAWLAVVKAGAVAVATMPLLRARELATIIDKAQVEFALCDRALKEELELARDSAPGLASVAYWGSGASDGLEAQMVQQSGEFAAAETSADDVAHIAFTSGTTGAPKGCMHFHRDILAMADSYSATILQPTADDIFCGTPPLAFTFGLGGLLVFPMRVGAAVALTVKPGPEPLMEAIVRHKATVCFTAPTAYRTMAGMTDEHDLASLRKCVSAGETLPKPTFELWHQATGIGIMDGIGTTEMLHIFISAAGDDIRPGATGRAVPGYSARIIGEDGAPVEAGEIGRLAIKGPTGCRYLADPKRQAEYVRDGWNLTGDAYRMDEDGYFWYQARTDDMIISAGYNIAGPEVEAALLDHPLVKDCAVVGAPDPERGTVVKAFVVLDQPARACDATAKDLQEFVKRQIAPYKYPRLVEFLPDLPRTETGKVQRFRLRQQEEQRLAAAS